MRYLRYYDEKIYLNGNEEALTTLKKIKKDYIERKSFCMLNFKNEIEMYNEFIKEVVKFLSSFNITNEIQYSLMISHLIKNGIFSIDEFDYECKLEYELEGFLGLNILYGKGCCRNASKFFEDVMTASRKYSEQYYCRASYTKLNFSRLKEANHVVNLINDGSNLYGFDAINIGLYYFYSKEEIKLLSQYINSYLRFKPYMGIITDKHSFEDIDKKYSLYEHEALKPYISIFDYQDLKNEIFNKLNMEKSMLLDFKEETMELKQAIYDGVNCKIKKLTNY